MFLRNKIVVTVLIAAFHSGVSFAGNAADTEPVVRESCAQAKQISHRQVGPPGKSFMLPVRSKGSPAQCSSAKSKPLILASYTDARGGLALVRGRTERALEQIYAQKSARTSAEKTNQCVAHTVMRQWSEASDACDAAVTAALDERAGKSMRTYSDRIKANAGAAAAYSNRAVMHWLSGNEVAAHDDLSKAHNLSPKASYVTRNLEFAEREPALVRAPANIPAGG
jgi:hypothetical protein